MVSLASSTILLVTLATPSLGIVLPSYFTRCTFNDPDLFRCIDGAATDVIPKLVKGNDDFGLPVLSPFKFSDVSFSDGATLDFELRNGTAGNLEDIVYSDSTYDRKTKRHNATATLPNLHVHGQYDLRGFVKDLPIYGNGTVTISFVNVTCRLYWNLTTVVRDEIEYKTALGLAVVYGIEAAKYSFSGLYNGDPFLQDMANQYLNAHWRILATIITPSVIASFRDIAVSISEAVGRKVPLRELFKF